MDEEQEKKTTNIEDTENQPDTEVEPVDDSKNESKENIEADNKHEVEAEAEAEAKSEPEPEPKPGPTSDSEKESDTDSQQSDEQPAPESEPTHKIVESVSSSSSSSETTSTPTEASKKTNSNTTLAIILSAVAIVFSAINFAYNYRARSGNSVTTFSSDGNSANFVEGSIADVASKVSPSVVSITTETRSQSYFGQSSTSTAAGTGFIISSDGYVLTNKHVVDGANQISVVMDDGTTYTDTKLIGTDPLNDCAIIKINNVSNLQAVTLGDSKTINVGQSVIAIGNALGLYQNTVTEGIVSGTGRSIVAGDGANSSSYEALSDMIQTDAAINQGNSGGPLVNAAGEVIGINTAISSSSTGTGFGFAIPISSVKGIVKSVLETGSFKRAYLGVYYNNITADVAKKNNLSVNSGAYVNSSNDNAAVIKDSAADKAGIKNGDIITAVNGIKIGKNGSLSSLLGEYTVGDTVNLTVLRDGSERNIEVTLTEYKSK